jgi:hypothetical protein
MLIMPVYNEVHLRCRYLLLFQNIEEKSDIIKTIDNAQESLGQLTKSGWD